MLSSGCFCRGLLKSNPLFSFQKIDLISFVKDDVDSQLRYFSFSSFFLFSGASLISQKTLPPRPALATPFIIVIYFFFFGFFLTLLASGNHVIVHACQCYGSWSGEARWSAGDRPRYDSEKHSRRRN